MRSLVVMIIMSAGCATAPAQTPPTWDTLPSEDETKEVATEDPEDRAQRHFSGTACEADARTLYQSNKLAGWDMMRACLRREDFKDIFLLSKNPWRMHIKDAPGLLPDLVRIAVRRNPEDVAGALREIGLKVNALDLGSLTVDADKKQLFAARVAVNDKAPDGSYEVEELIHERSRFDTVHFGRDVQGARRTGRTLQVTPGKCALKKDKDAWIVGRFGTADLGDGRWPFRCEAAAILGAAPSND
jgi:hypothetical protein